MLRFALIKDTFSGAAQSGRYAKRARSGVSDEKESIEAPLFHHTLTDVEARVGDRLVLSVTSTTCPAPIVYWQHANINIERSDERYLVRALDRGETNILDTHDD